MKIQFAASMQGTGCLRFDDDGSSIIKLTISADELHNAVKLVTMKGKTFTVTIEEEK
jgi:hypothetical protein